MHTPIIKECYEIGLTMEWYLLIVDTFLGKKMFERVIMSRFTLEAKVVNIFFNNIV